MFSEDFDYSPWQRSSVKSLSTNKNSEKTNAKSKKNSSSKKSPRRNSSDESLSSFKNQPTVKRSGTFHDNEFGKECSKLCRHGKKIPQKECVQTQKRISKDGAVALLKYQIRETKNSVAQQKAKYMKLMYDNIQLKDEISSDEKESYLKDKQLLQKYKKSQNAYSIISIEHQKHYSELLKSLHELKDHSTTVIHGLRNDLMALDQKIEQCRKQLKILVNYKEKEYPEKLDAIKSIKDRMNEISMENQEHIEYIEDIVAMGTYDFKQVHATECLNLKAEVAEKAMLLVGEPVKKLVHQNLIMKKEIDVHKKTVVEYDDEIKRLSKEIMELRKEESIFMSRRKNPQKYMERCLPNMELSLNVPQKTWLPI